ncbi:DNA polymerase-3 subunit delta [Weissella uvarum]|uniref:DNA polymerase III subunit delta n=1 Tax=Weissella uvarum TaxID=1479233 RepID=UPI00195F67B7|nr:DNA polymerase III subunit delta [Weissella uvarum]MBM7618126.1 DNA polymerase-3 subunit delta [Weissella uvarum]MCM0595132.1 DNA polymerase III subunit delta [Weissella uvarum]
MAINLKELNQQIDAQQIAPIYLIQGTDHYLLDLVRKRFVDLIDEPDRALNLAQFDMREIDLATAIDDARSVPFFGDRRVVLIENAYFLTGEVAKSKPEHHVEELIDYINQPEPQTVLVIMAPYEKLDGRKKVTKLLKERATYLSFGDFSEKDVRQMVQDNLSAEGYEITSDALQTLIQYTDMSVAAIMNELDKLKLYAFNTKKIDKKAVDQLVTRTLSQNVFDLIDDLLNQKLRDAVELYHELILAGEEPLRLLGAMVGQFRLLLQVKVSKQSEQGLATALKVHPYRVKLAKKTVRRYSYDALANAFLGLAEMEKALKSTSKDPEMLFELFVLRYQYETKS